MFARMRKSSPGAPFANSAVLSHFHHSFSAVLVVTRPWVVCLFDDDDEVILTSYYTPFPS